MKSSDLRNVVLLGHGGMGKTSLAEAMLYNSGAIDRLGRINEGNTVLDCDPEEIRRKASVSLSVAPFAWCWQNFAIKMFYWYSASIRAF